jgi:hypothetical protein
MMMRSMAIERYAIFPCTNANGEMTKIEKQMDQLQTHGIAHTVGIHLHL